MHATFNTFIKPCALPSRSTCTVCTATARASCPKCHTAALPSPGLSLRMCVCVGSKRKTAGGARYQKAALLSHRLFPLGLALLSPFLSNNQQHTCRGVTHSASMSCRPHQVSWRARHTLGFDSANRRGRGLFMAGLAPLRLSVFK